MYYIYIIIQKRVLWINIYFTLRDWFLQYGLYIQLLNVTYENSLKLQTDIKCPLPTIQIVIDFLNYNTNETYLNKKKLL